MIMMTTVFIATDGLIEVICGVIRDSFRVRIISIIFASRNNLFKRHLNRTGDFSLSRNTEEKEKDENKKKKKRDSIRRRKR